MKTEVSPKPAFSVAAIFLCVGLIGCSPEPERPAPVPPVMTFVIGAVSESPFRRFPGEVAATESSQMSFDVAGRIIEFPATQGMQANQGDLLGRLDDANFLTRVDAATADWTNARDELARRRQLRERGVIAQSELDQFQRAYDVADAARRDATRAFEDTRLVAPFTGQVARTMASNLQNVQAKEPVLVFQDVSAFEVDIQVPESVMSLAEQGVSAENARDRLEALVEFPSIPGQQFPLELESFSTEATRSARTFRVTFKLVRPDGANVLPGMTCTVLLRTRATGENESESDGTFLVPLSAISTADGGSWIWTIDPDTMQVSRVAAELIGPTGEAMQIRAIDLNPGDELVRSGVRFLEEGMTVQRMQPANR